MTDNLTDTHTHTQNITYQSISSARLNTWAGAVVSASSWSGNICPNKSMMQTDPLMSHWMSLIYYIQALLGWSTFVWTISRYNTSIHVYTACDNIYSWYNTRSVLCLGVHRCIFIKGGERGKGGPSRPYTRSAPVIVDNIQVYSVQWSTYIHGELKSSNPVMCMFQ